MIRLCWVPGHCDVCGKEIADELGRRESELDRSFVEKSVRIPIGSYFEAIKDWTLVNTNRA